MLNKKNTYITKKETYLSYLKEMIEFNCFCISAKQLKKITGLNTKEIDNILMNNGSIPITKHKKINMGISQTYYVFPIELIIANFFEASLEVL